MIPRGLFIYNDLFRGSATYEDQVPPACSISESHGEIRHSEVLWQGGGEALWPFSVQAMPMTTSALLQFGTRAEGIIGKKCGS